jgi:sigma-B regulation protein RsbU (phosphoserine phosphatase)
MARLNDALVEQHLSHATFATAIYGHIDTRTLDVVFSRGGHPNPLLMSRSGDTRMVTSDGSLLGIFPGEQFGQTKVRLQPGERLFIYSDGVELAFSENEDLDTGRWRDELVKRADLSTDQIVREFAEQVDSHSPDPARKKDDLTLIVLDVAQAA